MTGDAGWSPERRFCRGLERLALPGFGRAARFALLAGLGAAGLYPLAADALHLRIEDDVTTEAAKRPLVSGDALLLERRAADLAQACGLPLSALDRGLACGRPRARCRAPTARSRQASAARCASRPRTTGPEHGRAARAAPARHGRRRGPARARDAAARRLPGRGPPHRRAELPALHERPSALRASGELALGAEARGRLVGAVTWKRAGDTVDIHRLVVDPAAFRQGIASAAARTAAEEEPDARRTIVDAATRNHPAVALYQARGFRRVSERTVAGGVRIIRLERPA